jgi:hypothetical protein
VSGHVGGCAINEVGHCTCGRGRTSTGPVKRAGGIVLTQGDDGRWIHRFRQSTLGELDLCHERGRLTMAGLMPDEETDAACLGTSVHAGIEHAVRALMEGQYVTLEEIVAVAMLEWERLMALPAFQWKKYTDPGARRLIEACLVVFYGQVYDRLEPQHCELPFGPITIHEDDERVIEITGTIDYVDRLMGACDWKTDGQGNKFKRGWGGKAWELDRWGVQPTTYVTALRAMGLIDPQGPWPFTYFAFALGANVELVETTVLRQAADIDWLARKCLSYCKMVEADLDVWPKNDNHALCSEKWCPAWGQCKGASYEDVAWPLRP